MTWENFEQRVIREFEELRKLILEVDRKAGNIMATVQELDQKLTDIASDVDEIAVDSQALMDEIKKLQEEIAAGHPVTQAELDGLYAKASSIHTKSSSIADAVPTPAP